MRPNAKPRESTSDRQNAYYFRFAVVREILREIFDAVRDDPVTVYIACTIMSVQVVENRDRSNRSETRFALLFEKCAMSIVCLPLQPWFFDASCNFCRRIRFMTISRSRYFELSLLTVNYSL